MEGLSLKNILMGFVAGAIAVVTAHEIIDFLLLRAGLFPRVPWSMQPAAMTGVPRSSATCFGAGCGACSSP